MGNGERRGRSKLLVLMLGRRDVAVFGGASREPAEGGSSRKLDGRRGDCTMDGRVEDGSMGGGIEDKGGSTDDISWVSRCAGMVCGAGHNISENFGVAGP